MPEPMLSAIDRLTTLTHVIPALVVFIPLAVVLVLYRLWRETR